MAADDACGGCGRAEGDCRCVPAGLDGDAPAAVYIAWRPAKGGEARCHAAPTAYAEACDKIEEFNNLYAGKVHHFLVRDRADVVGLPGATPGGATDGHGR